MDTDDLTENAYEILPYTHEVNEFLWVEFGSMCRNYKNEDEYLNGLLNYTIDIKNSPDEFSDAWNLEENIETKELLKIEEKIRNVLSIPLEKRQQSMFFSDDNDIEEDIEDMFPTAEGMCNGCDLILPLNDLGLCDDCAGKLERDLIRNRDWDYSVSGFGLPTSEREGLRKKVIKTFGDKLELIAQDKRGKKKPKHNIKKERKIKPAANKSLVMNEYQRC